MTATDTFVAPSETTVSQSYGETVGETVREMPLSVYNTDNSPEDHIATYCANTKKEPPKKPSYELSPFSLVVANVAAPLYLYTSLKGKSDLWDKLLAKVPDDQLLGYPSLDIGCGRGLVLLKVAERKKALAARESSSAATKAYGIDVFKKNSPSVTAGNAAALGVLPNVVLHYADCTDVFPFRDGSFSLVTSSLSLQYVNSEGRKNAMCEMIRVCHPGGRLIVVGLAGYVRGLRTQLCEAGWPEDDIDVSWAGPGVMYGMWPAQVLTAKCPIKR